MRVNEIMKCGNDRHQTRRTGKNINWRKGTVEIVIDSAKNDTLLSISEKQKHLQVHCLVSLNLDGCMNH